MSRSGAALWMTTTRRQPVDDRGRSRAVPCHTAAMAPRFLLLADVAEILNIKPRQVYTLLHSGELPAIQVGGKGQWRIEASQLEAYIERKYAETRAMVEREQTDVERSGQERAD